MLYLEPHTPSRTVTLNFSVVTNLRLNTGKYDEITEDETANAEAMAMVGMVAQMLTHTIRN